MGPAGQLLAWIEAEREGVVRKEIIRQGGRVLGDPPPADKVHVSHSLGRTILRLPRDIDWPPEGAMLIAEQVPEGMLIRIIGMKDLSAATGHRD